MNFNAFKKHRAHHVEWMTANGYNNADCDTNGEFSVLDVFSSEFDVFVDIGFNHGIFIDKLGQDSSHYVLAFEPNPLLSSILLGKINRGSLVQKAVSDAKGFGQLNIYKDDTVSSLVGRTDLMPHFTNSVNCINIEIDILDSYKSLVLQNLSKSCFIKIDAEGSELPILRGASGLLKEVPVMLILFEYSIAWMQSGYSLKGTSKNRLSRDYWPGPTPAGT